MKRLSDGAMRLAEEYVLRNARVLERRRFEYLFRSGNAGGVIAALEAYRNPDGGFGNALEPDGRGPGSQPVAVQAALEVLDEVGAAGNELMFGVGDYLAAVSAEDGGLPFVHPNIRDFPRAPWWQIPDSYEGSLLPTARVVGLLHKNKVDHPWLAPATEFCWRKLEELTDTHPYEARACVAFLSHVPDRARAEAQAARLGRIVRDGGYVELGDAKGDLHYPWDYAKRPESVARQWFSDAEFEASLDWLIESQRDDGGWPVRWEIWTPVTEFEWGGWLTVEALTVLRAYDRLPATRPGPSAG